MLKDVDISRLETELAASGETTTVTEASARDWNVREVVPRLVCEPSAPEGLGAALAACDSAGAAVIPWGGGTQQRLGRPPRRADVILRTTALHRILEYEPADLTVTVEAGMRLADLQAELGKNGQWLAIDPPVAGDATVGGVVATGVSGPRRLKYGGLRDLVIGTRVATADGKLARAGGRVVKNVTGYDLNKAHIGGLGTLGVLVEISFKVAPRPAMERSWVGVFPSAEAATRARTVLLRLPVLPAALEVLNHRTARAIGLSVLPGQWVLLAAGAGFPQQVDRYLAEFEAAGRNNAATSLEPLSERAAADVWTAYGVATSELRWSAEALTCKAVMPPAAAGRLCDLAGGLDPEAMVWSHGHGAVFWSIPAAGEEYATLAMELRRAAEEVEGAMVAENWPTSLSGLDVWGGAGGPLELMEAIRRRFDPNGTINPGRYVGGI